MAKKRTFDKEFKINAVKFKQDHPDMSYDEAAEKLGVGVSTLHRWISEYSKEATKAGTVFRGSGNYASDEAKELARLKKENKDLKDALEVLKKAMNILNSQ